MFCFRSHLLFDSVFAHAAESTKTKAVRKLYGILYEWRCMYVELAEICHSCLITAAIATYLGKCFIITAGSASPTL